MIVDKSDLNFTGFGSNLRTFQFSDSGLEATKEYQDRLNPDLDEEDKRSLLDKASDLGESAAGEGGSFIGSLVSHPEDIPGLVATSMISAIVNAGNYAVDLAEFAGYDAEDYRIDQNRLMEEFPDWLAGTYKRHPIISDFAGDAMLLGKAFKGINYITKAGGPVHKLLTSAGLGGKWVNSLFVDTAKIDEGYKTLAQGIAKLRASGINPSSVRSVGREAGKLAPAVAKQAAKQTFYETGALAASGYKHDTFFPEGATAEDTIFWWGLVPAVTGVGFPVIANRYKVANMFAKSNEVSARNLNNLLNEQMISRGYKMPEAATEKPQVTNWLTDYGIAGNAASDTLTENMYTVKNLRSIKDNTLASFDNNPNSFGDVSRIEVERAYDSQIDAARKRVDTALDSLIKPTATSEEKTFIKTQMTGALDKWSNTCQGCTELQEAPKTQAGLDAITGRVGEKLANLKKRQQSTRISEETKLAELEKIQKLEGTYHTLYSNGEAYDANNFHMRWSDNPNNLKNIKLATTKNGFESSVNVKFNDFLTEPDNLTVKALTDGTIKFTRRKGFEYNLNQTETAAYDPAWQLLKKQKEFLFNLDKKTKLPRYKAMIESGKSFDIDLTKASVPQLGYLHDLSKSMDVEDFSRLFKFKDSQIRSTASRLADQTGAPIDSITITDVLKHRYITQAKYLMKNRISLLSKQPLKSYVNGRFSEESLVEELTGLKLKPSGNSGLANDYGNNYTKLINTMERAVDTANSLDIVPLADRQPRRFVLQTSSEAAGLTDEINNKLIDRLRLNTANRKRILLESGNLTSEFAKAIEESPQYANGYVSTPTSVGYDQDMLGKAGKYLLTQEFRTTGNTTLNAAISLNNKLKMQFTEIISNKMAPFTEACSKLLKNKPQMDQFGKVRYQSQSGWLLADAEPVDLGNGKYGLLLNPEGSLTNQRIAERQAKWGNTKLEPVGEYLPDPTNPSQPMLMDREVAELVYNNHQHNKEIWESQQTINQSIGRQGSRFRNYYFEPINFANKEVRVIGSLETIDGRQSFKPEIFITANTPEQAEAYAKLQMANAGLENNPRYTIKTAKEAGLEKEFIRDGIDAGTFEWADYTDSWRQQLTNVDKYSGIRVSQGSIIDTGRSMLEDFLEGKNHQMQLVAKRTRSAMFSDEINQAMSMLATKAKGTPGYDELRQYIDALRGTRSAVEGVHSPVYKAFDRLVDYGAKAFNDFWNLPQIDRATELARYANGNLRQTYKVFDSAEEINRIYGAKTNPIQAMQEGIRLVTKRNVKHSKELVGNMNRLISIGQLGILNAGYAIMNIASLPVTMPMARRALSRRVGETARMQQARIGAFGKVIGNGENVAFDALGGFISTVGYYMRNTSELKTVLSEARSLGVLSMQSEQVAKTFLHPADTLFGKAANKVIKSITSIGTVSEQLSRVIPYLEGYRLGRMAGLAKEEAHAFSRRFMEDCVGSYIASNKPWLMQDAAGSGMGLYYTYIHNFMQNVIGHSLAGDKAALATGLAMQTLLFGAESIPGVEKLEDYVFPIAGGKDLYVALREKGLSDTEARGVMYGGLSAWTGLDFSSKGTINAVAVPGFKAPPVFDIVSNLVDGAYEAVKAVAGTSGTDPNLLWEIAQTHMPITAVRSGINLGLGYKTSKDGNIVADSTQTGYTLANLMSMRLVDESLARRGLSRLRKYNQQKQEATSMIRRNMQAGIRSGDDVNNVVADGIRQAIANGLSPKYAKQFIKLALTKAGTKPAEQELRQLERKRFKTPAEINLLKSLRLEVYGAEPTIYDNNYENRIPMP